MEGVINKQSNMKEEDREEEDQKYNENEDEQDYDSENEQFEQEEENDTLEWQDGIRNAEKSYISSAKEYLEWMKTQKKVKIMSEQMPWDSTLQICDISLHRGGPFEDKKYAYFPKYRINIKRGNSICVVQNSQNEEENEVFFCRRGMRKFYDLIPEYFNENKKLSGYYQKVKFLMLNEAKEKLESGQFKVHLYNLFKENGEHCQISYLMKFDMWLIASKNVTILVKKREDAEKYYHKLRYYWAKLISDEWFNILDSMKQENIDKLKEQMQNLTFIGEHCGNQKHQHIFKYDKVQIIFYSIVENNSPNVCLPVDEAFNIFNKFNLNTVKKREIKDIETFEDFKQKLNNELQKVATGRIEDEGEGGVVYIVEEDKNTSQQKTISCCKLKTTEYNIYRKLREMLKLCLLKKSQAGRKNERFKQEVDKMCEHHLPPKPIDHYLMLAKNAFSYMDKNYSTLSQDILRYEFISFIEGLSSQEQQLKDDSTEKVNKQGRLILITPPGFLNDLTLDRLSKTLQVDQIETLWRDDQKITSKHLNLLHIVPKVSEKINEQNIHFSIVGFDQEGLQKCLNTLEKDIDVLKSSKFCSNMFQYINSKNKQQMIELLFQKVQVFITLLKAEYPQKYSIFPGSVSSDDLINQLEQIFSNLCSNQISGQIPQQNIPENNQQQIEVVNQQNKTGQKIKLIVIIPIAPPGSGKTYFCKLLANTVKEEYPDCSYYSISSDEIRSSLMENYKQTRKEREYTLDQLFEATAQSAKLKYFSVLKELLLKISTDSKQQAILYLDRMHPPQILEESFTFLKENSPSTLDLKISSFIVKSSSEFSYKKFTYYFSEQILMNCMNRTLNRDDHETMQGDSVYISKISFKFFQMFRNFKIQSLSSYKQINLFVQIPLINESQTQVNQALIKKIEKCLDLIPPGGQPPDSPAYMDFIQSFYAANLKFEYPDQEKLKTIAKNYIKACLNIN